MGESRSHRGHLNALPCAPRALPCRKGQVLDDRERPDAAKFRERFFNFYDDRLMGEAWYSAKDPVTIEMFFRLLAVCHTVIPDGPTDEKSIKYEVSAEQPHWTPHPTGFMGHVANWQGGLLGGMTGANIHC